MGRKLQQDAIYLKMVKILKLGPITKTYLMALIRENFKISRQALLDRIKVWDKAKIVQLQGNNIRLLNPLANKHIPLTSITTTRQENYRLKYLLKDPLKPLEPPIVLRSAGFQLWLPSEPAPAEPGQAAPKQEQHSLNNHEQQSFIMEGYTARLNTSSLELWCPHIYSTSRIPSIISEDEAKRLLDQIALKIEKRLQKHISFKLVRLGPGTDKDVLYSERVDIELEEEEHAMARAKPKEYKFEVHHPIDNKLRAKIDFSRGADKPEFALLHRKDAGVDRDTLNAQFNGLFDGKVNLLDLPEIKGIIGKIAQLQEQQASQSLKTNEQLTTLTQQISVHNPFWQSMNVVAAKLSSPDPRERHKAEKAIKEETDKYKQRRLS